MYPFKRIIISLFAGLLLFSTVDVKASEPAAQAKKAYRLLDVTYDKYKRRSKDNQIFDQANACLLIVYIDWIGSMLVLTGNMNGLENENQEFSRILKERREDLKKFVDASEKNQKIFSSVKREVTRLQSNGILNGGKNMTPSDFSDTDFSEADQEFSLCLEPSFINSVSK